MTGLLIGRFLLLGVIAWVAAIVLGVGVRFELWSWQRRWPIAGMLAGLGTFGLFVYSYPLAFLGSGVAVGSLLGLVGGLFVGCGLAVSYAGLFARTDTPRPILEPGSAEERLWLLDTVDRLRPQRLDWSLTGVMAIPGVALAYVGATSLSLLAPVVIGLASLAGPAYALLGLALRRRESTRLLEEMETSADHPPIPHGTGHPT